MAKKSQILIFSCPLATIYGQIAVATQRRTELLESKLVNIDEVTKYLGDKQEEIKKAKATLENLKVEIRAATLRQRGHNNV